uniref:Reverse transcriptase zinc-binding domain-containing protein n=1 Tax=Magallana gigas TaxID=29159 RepID=K1QT84_MAGGI
MLFNYNGKFLSTQKHCAAQGNKAMFSISSKMKDLNFNVETQLNVFDTYVKSVLSYGAEIWGFHKGQDVEKVHINFCKKVLGVRKNTCNSAVYYEVGRFPLEIFRKQKIFKYWFKLRNSKNCILKACYEDMVKNNDIWISNIRKELSILGLADLYQSTMKESVILDIIFNRMCDVFKQKVVNDISNASKCILYKHVVDHFCLQVYLKKPIHVKYRKLITRLRLSSHDLKIETGRYENLTRDCRKCESCNLNVIEDEFHFLLICPSLCSLRDKYIKKYYSRKPSVYKVIQLLSTSNTKELCNLGKYLYYANKQRTLHVNYPN